LSPVRRTCSYTAKIPEVDPGEVIGEVALLSSGRRTASVVATSPVKVIALFKRDVLHLERDAPEAAERIHAAIDAHAGSSASDD
jgi:CRP-like cAMP-binding protein